MAGIEAKAFAQAVCSTMVQDSPDRYLLNMSKKLAYRKDLPRLPAQRSHVDGSGSSLAAHAAWRDRSQCRFTGARCAPALTPNASQ